MPKTRYGFQTTTQTLTTTGASQPVIILSPNGVGFQPPTVGVSLGSTGTYTLQWSGDDPDNPAVQANNYAGANWFAWPAWSGLTASNSDTIAGAITMVRLSIAANGSAIVFTVCQQVN